MDSDFEITNETIKSTKEDIVNFKLSNPNYSNWFNSKTDEQERFVKDYMTSRGLSGGFEFYNQLTYVCMCRDWNLNPNPLSSTWYDRNDIRNNRLQPSLGSDTRNIHCLSGMRSKKNRSGMFR